MKHVLNIIVLLLVIAAVVSAAGCAEKTQTSINEIKGVSEQVTPAATTKNITSTIPVVTPASSVTSAPSVKSTPSATNASMKDMSSTSKTSLDSSSNVVDVVCKMVIDKRTAEFTSEYNGITYYFCSADCKSKFDANPEKYINSEDGRMDASEQATTTETSAETNSTDSTSSNVVDVVCKMVIDKRTAEFTSEYNGITYYFCSADCKSKFDANPEKYINNLLEVPVATFIASPISGNAPLNVNFTDLSAGTPASWNWNFGDGNSSTEQNPAHLYYTAGNYTVNLMVTNNNGTNSTSTIIIVLQTSLSITNFSSNVTEGYAPLSVQFNDLSKNATGWKWDFGDGANSTNKNPVHTYSKTGKYTVTLTVKNSKGSNKITRNNHITVSTPLKAPVAAFAASPTSGYASLTVIFTDKSTGTPTSWNWNFGDGTVSTVRNPVHTYSKTGKYTVTLTVKNSYGPNKITKNNFITVNSSEVLDVVCKMTIDKNTAEFTSNYKGTTYYFCSADCKTKFDADPGKYVN